MTTPISDPVLIFAIVMAIILIGPLLFQKLKIPGLLGLIFGGALVGPSVLGLLVRDATIELLGTVGLTYLMFVAGLSLDLARFQKLRNQSLLFGTISFTIPLALSLLIALPFFKYSFSAALLIGCIVGSHTLLAYPIVARLGLTKNMAVTLAMGGTLITDTLSLGLLAVVSGAQNGEAGAGFWLAFFAKIGLFVFAAVLLIPNLGRLFFRTVKYDSTTDFVFMIVVLFTTAHFAERAGLAPIIGAFLAGLLLNRLVPESGTLMSRIQFVGDALFIPFFLVSVGMLVDVSVLTQAPVWVRAFLFTMLVLVGKGWAAAAAGKAFGLGRDETFLIFGLTTPQAAATLAVTLIGFELQLLSSTDVNAVILMILLTCIVGPALVEKFGRQLAVREAEKPYDPEDAPQRLLIPLANPETAKGLMDIAFMVHDTNSTEPVFPLAVARDQGDVAANVAESEKMLTTAVELAAAAAVQAVPVTRIDLNVAKGISRAIDEKRISNVIIGWNGQVTATSKIFGSILDQLLQETEVLVVVCKLTRPVNLFERLVVAIPPLAALEPGFAEALRTVKLMAEQMGVELHLISTESADSKLRVKIDSISPELDLYWDRLESWKSLTGWLDENREENDLFVLLSAREGTVSWRPTLNRLPSHLASRFVDLCFLVLYPAQDRESQPTPIALS